MSRKSDMSYTSAGAALCVVNKCRILHLFIAFRFHCPVIRSLELQQWLTRSVWDRLSLQYFCQCSRYHTDGSATIDSSAHCIILCNRIFGARLKVARDHATIGFRSLSKVGLLGIHGAFACSTV